VLQVWCGWTTPLDPLTIHSLLPLLRQVVGLAVWQKSVAFAGLTKPLPDVSQWWRLFTSVLLHGHWLHLLVNFYALLTLGRLMEVHSRRVYLPIVFVISAIVGSWFTLQWSSWTHVGGISVGASGGLMGLIGFLAILGIRRRDVLPGGFAGNIAANIVLIGAIGLASQGRSGMQVDNACHLGGVCAGLALGFAMIPRKLSLIPKRWPVGVGAMAVFILFSSTTLAAWLLVEARRTRRVYLADVTTQFAGFQHDKYFRIIGALFELPQGATTSGRYVLQAAVPQPCVIAVPFQRLDERGFVYEVRIARVLVGPGAEGSFLKVDPSDEVWDSLPTGIGRVQSGGQVVLTWPATASNISGGWSLTHLDIGPAAGIVEPNPNKVPVAPATAKDEPKTRPTWE
jgi:membrane associated rhomboid family serine protease